MSDTTIIVISILVFFLILFGVTAWLVFVYFPNKTMSIGREVAETVKNTFGLEPQVTINQKIISKRSDEIMELAMIVQDFDIEHETSHMWMKSEKRINLRGTYRAKIGFDLQKGFNIEVHRGGFFKAGQVVLELPHAEILSIEPLDIHKSSTSGLINWVTGKDMEEATRHLAELAQDKVSKLEMLDRAEKRIEKRLNDALLPKLTNYRYEHDVKFLERSDKHLHVDRENEKDDRLALPENIHDS